MDLGPLIRQRRVAMGLSQRELARQMSLTPSAIAQWELGATIPSIENRAELRRRLGIPFAQLLPELSEKHEPYLEDQTLQAISRIAASLPPQLREALLIAAAGLAEAHKRSRR